MASTSRGVPYPLATDPNNTAADLQALAGWVNDRPGVAALTTTQRNALTGAALWDGRVVLNTTTDRLNRYDGGTSTWVQIPDSADIAALLDSSGTPTAIGSATTSSRGAAAVAARGDHVHAAPAWIAFNPTLESFAATTTWGRYVRIGNTIHAQWRATITIVPNSTMRITLPLPARTGHPTGQQGPIGVASCHDVGSTSVPGMVVVANGFNDRAEITSTNAANQYWQVNTPIPWAVNDEVGFNITYECN